MNALHTLPAGLVIDFEHDDYVKQEHLLLHIKNLLRDFEDKPLLVEVVAYGPGVMLLDARKTDFSDRIVRLQQQGVQFEACRNAMKKFGIEDKDLLADITPVPSGVGRIVKAQLGGYVYFKA